MGSMESRSSDSVMLSRASSYTSVCEEGLSVSLLPPRNRILISYQPVQPLKLLSDIPPKMPPLERSNSRLSDASTAYRPAAPASSGSWIPAKHCGAKGWESTQERIESHHKTLLDEFIESKKFSDVDYAKVWKGTRTQVTHKKAPNASRTRHESIATVVTTFDASNSEAVGERSFTTEWSCGGKCAPWLVKYSSSPNGKPLLVNRRLPTEDEERVMSQNDVDRWWKEFTDADTKVNRLRSYEKLCLK